MGGRNIISLEGHSIYYVAGNIIKDGDKYLSFAKTILIYSAKPQENEISEFYQKSCLIGCISLSNRSYKSGSPAPEIRAAGSHILFIG